MYSYLNDNQLNKTNELLLLTHDKILAVVDLMNTYISSGKCIYIHDIYGSDHVISVIIAYLMKYELKELHEAYILVQSILTQNFKNKRYIFRENSRSFKNLAEFARLIRQQNLQ